METATAAAKKREQKKRTDMEILCACSELNES